MKTLHRLRALVGRMPIRRQLYAAFGLVLLLTAGVGAVALDGLGRVDAQARAMDAKWLRSVGLLGEMRIALTEARDFEIKHSRTADTSYHSEYEEKLGAATKQVTATLARFAALPGDEAERAAIAKFDKGWTAYRKFGERVVTLGREKKQQDAADISDGGASMAFDEAMGALNGLSKNAFAGGATAAATATTIYSQARLLVIGLLAGALAAGMLLSFLITRHLLRQLGGEPAVAAELARRVSDGDLTAQIAIRAGDTDSLMARLQTMQHNLSGAVAEVRRGSENVATASSQIAQGNHDLSTRTEQQASALQETAATMDELAATVRNNAENAQQASQLAQGASAVAVKGGAVVGEVVTTMKGINDSSRRSRR